LIILLIISQLLDTDPPFRFITEDVILTLLAELIDRGSPEMQIQPLEYDMFIRAYLLSIANVRTLFRSTAIVEMLSDIFFNMWNKICRIQSPHSNCFIVLN
jgi:hypothetical protein